MSGFASTGEFDQPWNDEKTALVLDLFYANTVDWERLKEEPRVIGIIHKSTIGRFKIDPGYLARKQEAQQRGYLWGSYHWGTGGDPSGQADHYIDAVQPAVGELIALDLEDARSRSLMNADEALVFIARVKERTGRYPVLYTNHASVKFISEQYEGTDFERVPLWYARFKQSVDDFPQGLWSSYALWQFSSEIKQQISIPGTRSDMDVSVYNGSVTDLKSAWPLDQARS